MRFRIDDSKLAFRTTVPSWGGPASAEAVEAPSVDVSGNGSINTPIENESSVQEFECDGPPEPELEGIISPPDGIILAPTPAVTSARKAQPITEARAEEHPPFFKQLDRPFAAMKPATFDIIEMKKEIPPIPREIT